MLYTIPTTAYLYMNGSDSTDVKAALRVRSAIGALIAESRAMAAAYVEICATVEACNDQWFWLERVTPNHMYVIMYVWVGSLLEHRDPADWAYDAIDGMPITNYISHIAQTPPFRTAQDAQGTRPPRT